MNLAKLGQRYEDLMDQSQKVRMPNTRIGYLAAADKIKEASSVADLIGGAPGAARRADAEQILACCLLNLGNMAAAARAACSSLRAARASGNRGMLVIALTVCGSTSGKAPGEMVEAERESREQERLSGFSSYGGLDLSQEGRISLPTTPAALVRLRRTYYEAAVGICDAALTEAGGRGSPAAADARRVPSLCVEAEARGFLRDCLHLMGEEQQRSLELLRQAVALRRQAVRTAAPGGHDTVRAQQGLAYDLSALGLMLKAPVSERMVEADACLLEALALSKGLDDMVLAVRTLTHLINLCGEAHAVVGPAAAMAFRSRLNQHLVQMGRSVETSCSICLEPLAPPADDAAEDAVVGGGSSDLNSCVRVLECEHQFHYVCLVSWRCMSPHCPLCKK